MVTSNGKKRNSLCLDLIWFLCVGYLIFDVSGDPVMEEKPKKPKRIICPLCFGSGRRQLGLVQIAVPCDWCLRTGLIDEPENKELR